MEELETQKIADIERRQEAEAFATRVGHTRDQQYKIMEGPSKTWRHGFEKTKAACGGGGDGQGDHRENEGTCEDQRNRDQIMNVMLNFLVYIVKFDPPSNEESTSRL